MLLRIPNYGEHPLWNYSLLIDTYIKKPAECEYHFDTVKTIPYVKHKANWAMHWIVDK